MKSIYLNRIIFISLTILMFIFLWNFDSPLNNFLGNTVMGKAFFNPNYKVTEGNTGLPFQFGLFSSILLAKFINNSIFVFTYIFVLFLFIFFLYKGYYHFLMILMFPIFLFFGPENLNFVGYLLFLFTILLLKKNNFFALPLVFILVNFNPVLLFVFILIFVIEKKSFYYYFVLLPINIFWVFKQGVYFLFSFKQYWLFSPFLFFYVIVIFIIIFFYIERKIRFYWIIFFIIAILEPEIVPYIFIYLLFKIKKFIPTLKSNIVTLLVLLLFIRGVPLGNGVVLRHRHNINFYNMDITKKMPHYGRIYHPLNLGYVIDYLYFPMVGATRAFYAKTKYKFTFKDVANLDNNDWNENELGLIFTYTNKFYYEPFNLLTYLKQDNLLLTYISPYIAIFDRDPDRHIIMYYEPYYLQKIYLNKTLKDYEIDDLWFYIDKYYENYRDIASVNLSLFTAYKLKNTFYESICKKRLKHYKKDEATYLIWANYSNTTLNKALIRYPYDFRFWYLKYKQTHKKIYLKIAKFFNGKLIIENERQLF